MHRQTSKQRSFIPQMSVPKVVSRQLEKSWAKPFRLYILPVICEMESEFKQYYCPDNGRPQKLVSVLLTALIFKEMFDLTPVILSVTSKLK